MYKVKRFSGKYSRHLDSIGAEIQDVKEVKDPAKVAKFVSKHKVPIALTATAATAATAYGLHRRNKKRKEAELAKAEQLEFSVKKKKNKSEQAPLNAGHTVGVAGIGTTALLAGKAMEHGEDAKFYLNRAKSLRGTRDNLIRLGINAGRTGQASRGQVAFIFQTAKEAGDTAVKGVKYAREAKKLARNYKAATIGSAVATAGAFTAAEVARYKKSKELEAKKADKE